jgi:hypothetical protein
VLLLAVRTEIWMGILAIGLVGVGTTMLTTYLFPAYVARTPPTAARVARLPRSIPRRV